MSFALNDVETFDKQTAAWHEAGHYIATQHYGVAVDAYLIRSGEPNLEINCWIGQTRFRRYDTTSFQEAVICWAGKVAEAIRLHQGDLGGIDLSTLQVDFEYDEEGNFLSPTDRAGIEQYTERKNPLVEAFDILKKRYEELKRAAQELEECEVIGD